MKEAHEIAFAVAREAIAQNQVVHPPADIQGVDLHVAVVGEGGRDSRVSQIQAMRPTEKTAGTQRGHTERWRQSHGRIEPRMG